MEFLELLQTAVCFDHFSREVGYTSPVSVDTGLWDSKSTVRSQFGSCSANMKHPENIQKNTFPRSLVHVMAFILQQRQIKDIPSTEFISQTNRSKCN